MFDALAVYDIDTKKVSFKVVNTYEGIKLLSSEVQGKTKTIDRSSIGKIVIADKDSEWKQ